MHNKNQQRLWRDACIVVASTGLAIVLGWSGVFRLFFIATEGSSVFGSFVAGLFFTSVFTTAPATIALAQIAQANSIFLVALLGGMGAVIGDLVIFRFVRNHLVEDFSFLLRMPGKKRWVALFHLRATRWLFMFIGALIVASPLPDELGLAMMGITKLKTIYFIPLSFTLNALGILLIGFIAQAI